MKISLSHVNLNVPNYDEALDYYTSVMGMTKMDDIPMGDGGRWVTVAFEPQAPVQFVLFEVKDPAKVGVADPMVLATDDCKAAYDMLNSRGVEFSEKPTSYFWGVQAQFKDKYGYQYVMVQQTPMPASN
jgi:predicted enzyme related to lactoylglutathione lyase